MPVRRECLGGFGCGRDREKDVMAATGEIKLATTVPRAPGGRIEDLLVPVKQWGQLR